MDADVPPWPDMSRVGARHLVFGCVVISHLFLAANVPCCLPRAVSDSVPRVFCGSMESGSSPSLRAQSGFYRVVFQGAALSITLYCCNLALRSGVTVAVDKVGTSAFHHELITVILFVHVLGAVLKFKPRVLNADSHWLPIHWIGMAMLLLKRFASGSETSPFHQSNGGDTSIFREVDFQFMQSCRMYVSVVLSGKTGFISASVSNFLFAVSSIMVQNAQGTFSLESIFVEALSFFVVVFVVYAFAREWEEIGGDWSKASKQIEALKDLMTTGFAVFVILQPDLTVSSPHLVLGSFLNDGNLQDDHAITDFRSAILPEYLDEFRQFIDKPIEDETTKRSLYTTLVSRTGASIPVRINHVRLPKVSMDVTKSRDVHVLSINKRCLEASSTNCNSRTPVAVAASADSSESFVSGELRGSFESWKEEDQHSQESSQSFVGEVTDFALMFDGLNPDMRILKCTRSFDAVSGCLSARHTSLLSWLAPAARGLVTATIRKEVITTLSSNSTEPRIVRLGLWSLYPPRPKGSGSEVVFRAMCTMLLPKSSEVKEDGSYNVTVVFNDVKRFRERDPRRFAGREMRKSSLLSKTGGFRARTSSSMKDHFKHRDTLRNEKNDSHSVGTEESSLSGSVGSLNSALASNANIFPVGDHNAAGALDEFLVNFGETPVQTSL
eukprot:TRINITY_DN8443_c0_g1_i1.p1 TRINITY_DN8443_c0_g1~~TRINITY_DN8443_c0_g1_i1.p1  ORF type:complete len:668 (+),score=93.91 TRINITY_DN8443_c0_g1_i1:40-2043(+)